MTVLPLFETPVFLFEVPDTDALDAELRERLVTESDDGPGIVVSNRGGWHSAPDLSKRPDPACLALCDMLVAHFQIATEQLAAIRGIDPVPPLAIGLTAWAMVMRDGDYTVMHDHPQATWSCAYYVDPGDPDEARHPDAGHLALVDPRRASAAVIGLELFPAVFSVRPTRGLLVIFPGYLQHYVHPYRGTRPRVVVAANASVRV